MSFELSPLAILNYPILNYSKPSRRNAATTQNSKTQNRHSR
nr:MAG TPA: hypothetical protein [Caudoviricetes sp.]